MKKEGIKEGLIKYVEGKERDQEGFSNSRILKVTKVQSKMEPLGR